MRETLEVLVKKAKSGNKKALEQVIIGIQDMVYNLSLKMLLFHEDANDATQEILIKVVTHLSTFNHKSQFKTWVYRVATNHLLNIKGKKSKEFAMPFEEYEKFIDIGLSNQINYTQNEGEIALLEDDIRIGCTQGLLLCLNESDRLVYVLGVILEFNSAEASKILDITADNFRKKLSRSKTKIKNFMDHKCGLINPKNPCRCHRKIDFLIDHKYLDPNHLAYANTSGPKLDLSENLDALQKTAEVYRSTPNYFAPESILKEIKQAIEVY